MLRVEFLVSEDFFSPGCEIFKSYPGEVFLNPLLQRFTIRYLILPQTFRLVLAGRTVLPCFTTASTILAHLICGRRSCSAMGFVCKH